MSPTGSLREALMKHGLRPGSIIWDHLPHRFPGKGKPPSNRAGWYIAFADRKGAVFGDYSRDLRQHWQPDHEGPFDAKARKRWREESRRRAKERAKKAQIALEAMREKWDEASDTVDHPYLKRKGIDEPVGGLRQHGDTLFIPAYTDDGTLSSIQRIYLDDGKFQKRFWKGRSSKGCRMTLGRARFAATKTLYLCEGYATGWTIHKALNAAVVVAFNEYGLVEVGRSLRAKYPDAKIIVCADNDQWSTILRGKEEIPNPGVIYAQEACEAIDGVLRIPQFEDFDTRPTDFDDLRQLKGMDAVKHWLENSPPDPAALVADEVAERIERDREDWRDTAPFRCLGYNDGHYYYLPQTTGQVVRIAGKPWDRNHMIALHTDSDWWARHWPGPNSSVDWERAMMALMKECRGKRGFVLDDIRGVGAWRNESGGLILHLGDRLLPPGEKKYVKPETYDDGARVYPRLPRVIGPATDKAMGLQEARSIYKMFTEDLAWANEAAGALLAGWTVLAPFCGALSWRPAVWLTGIPKSGKWIILENVVKPLLGGMYRDFPGGTTEAAIRQTIRADPLPVVLYDERDWVKAMRQVDAVSSLIRMSASRLPLMKGSPTGNPITYRVRSMFCLASIGGGPTKMVDKSRITILSLKSNRFAAAEVRAEQWKRLQRRIANIVPSVGGRLLSRTLKKFRSGEFDEILKVTKAAATEVFGDTRSGDQYGTLAAGAWMLREDRMPNEDEMRAWFQKMGERHPPEGHRVLWLIIQSQETVEGSEYTVRELVEIVAGPETERRLPKETAELHLRTLGIRVVDNALHLANTSEWIKRKMSTTPLWLDTLRTIEGVEAGGKTMRFHTVVWCPKPPGSPSPYAPSSQASKRRPTLTPDL